MLHSFFSLFSFLISCLKHLQGFLISELRSLLFLIFQHTYQTDSVSLQTLWTGSWKTYVQLCWDTCCPRFAFQPNHVLENNNDFILNKIHSALFHSIGLFSKLASKKIRQNSKLPVWEMKTLLHNSIFILFFFEMFFCRFLSDHWKSSQIASVIVLGSSWIIILKTVALDVEENKYHS